MQKRDLIQANGDFTVILLTFSVGMVKINDCFVWQGSVCPV